MVRGIDKSFMEVEVKVDLFYFRGTDPYRCTVQDSP